MEFFKFYSQTGIRLNIFKQGDTTLSGAQIDELSDLDIERLIRAVSIFYRASPRHKLRIVKVGIIFLEKFAIFDD